jgi:hypothetical protein
MPSANIDPGPEQLGIFVWGDISDSIPLLSRTPLSLPFCFASVPTSISKHIRKIWFEKGYRYTIGFEGLPFVLHHAAYVHSGLVEEEDNGSTIPFI